MTSGPPTSRPPREEFLVFGQPVVAEEAIAEVVATLRSGWIGTGPKTAQFAQRLGGYVGAPLARATSSCTAALHVALILAGVGPGDEVVTSPLTFASTANVVLHTGATPVFADVDPVTMNLHPAEVERAVTGRTRAIIPVHLAGRPCDLDALWATARRHDLVVIEDAAHALGASYHGRPVGGLSDFTAFSFYPTKNLTTAEGGLLTALDDSLADRIDALLQHGLSADAWQRYSSQRPGRSGVGRYEVVVPGYKYNMTDVQASLGLHQVGLIDAWRDRREEIWAAYDEAFQGLPLVLPSPPEPGTVHARHLYTVLVDEQALGHDRDWFRAELHHERIGTGIHFLSLHQHPYYRDAFGYERDQFPNAARIGEQTLSLPLSPHLDDADVADVIAAVHRVCERA